MLSFWGTKSPRQYGSSPSSSSETAAVDALVQRFDKHGEKQVLLNGGKKLWHIALMSDVVVFFPKFFSATYVLSPAASQAVEAFELLGSLEICLPNMGIPADPPISFSIRGRTCRTWEICHQFMTIITYQLSNSLGSLLSTQFGWSRMSIFCWDGSSTRESSDEISRIGWWAAHYNPYLVGYIRYIQHKLRFSHILQPIEPSSFRLTRVAPCSEVIIIEPRTGGEVLIPVDGWWGWSLSPLRPTCQTLKQWHPANMRCQWNTFFIWTPSIFWGGQFQITSAISSFI